jgi:hypothetical protein
MTQVDIFAPPGGWRVRIIDHSGGAEGGVVEEVGGFPTIMHANEFARRYVRDSIEHCRTPGLSRDEVLEAWLAFGEDTEVLDAGEAAWTSAVDRNAFAAAPGDAESRDWRALDPRRDGDADEDDGE